MVYWVCPPHLALSNSSKSLALGWWMVQMTVRPPRARALRRETTWKQDELSKPLERKQTQERRSVLKKTIWSSSWSKQFKLLLKEISRTRWTLTNNLTNHKNWKFKINRKLIRWINKSIGATFCSPGGFVEEHHRRIVDELQSDGQPLPLASGQVGGSGFSTVQQT